jgi:hypothetical protein
MVRPKTTTYYEPRPHARLIISRKIPLPLFLSALMLRLHALLTSLASPLTLVCTTMNLSVVEPVRLAPAPTR